MTSPAVILVTDSDGRHGFIDAAATGWTPREANVTIQLHDGNRIIVPTDILQPQHDGTYLFPFSIAALVHRSGDSTVAPVFTLPVVEEQLHVDKLRHEARVRVTKRVHEREQQVDVPLARQDVIVERVPVGRVLTAPVPTRQEGDTTIIPLFEEVLVVEKRLMLREELHIRVQRTETHDHRTVRLRSEDITIDHLDGPAAQAPAPSPQPPGETP